MTPGRVAEWEQWDVAHQLVSKHGKEAPIVMAMRAEGVLEKGEVLGANTYVAIKLKSEALLNGNDGAIH